MVAGIQKLHHLGQCQVILNFYEDDMMIEREAFFFEDMVITDEQIRFNRKNQTAFHLDLSPYSKLEVLGMFKNYFALRTPNKRVELYFV
ncbi:MAG TPA: hypothetical protein VJ824_01400 [Bacillota bacterium]|nr:hypothetical protein [Bacillota bacterium]